MFGQESGACSEYIWLEGDLDKVITLADSDPLGCAIYRHGAGCHGCGIGANCHSTGLFHTLNDCVGVCGTGCVFKKNNPPKLCVHASLCPYTSFCLFLRVLLPLGVLCEWALAGWCVWHCCGAAEVQHQTMFTTTALVLFILFTPVQSAVSKGSRHSLFFFVGEASNV